MPKKLEPVNNVSATESAAILGQLGGSLEKKKIKALRGDNPLAMPSSCNIMLFGEQGTGKTYLVVQLLEAGLKVFVLMTDFAKSGLTTVKNYFNSHPDKASLLENLVVVYLDAEQVMEFVRNPQNVEIELPSGEVTDIYTFNPDVLFWDGITAFQQVDLEGMLSGDTNDFIREEQKFDYWKKNQNGTLLTLVKFLTLHSPDKPWSKVVTALSKKNFEYEDTGEKDKKGQRITQAVMGTNKDGPMLHTGARKISGAGFDVMLETRVTNMGREVFEYVSSSPEKMVKSRGFNLPPVMNVTTDNFWTKYIAPRLSLKKPETSSAVETSK